MNLNIWLVRVEYEMLNELQRRDEKYKKVLEEMLKGDLEHDHEGLGGHSI
jgi:hypothetical protein